jgi:hypothetical protein
MSIQKKFYVRNPPSDRLSVVEGKHNSATRCANPQCSKELLYLREGSLQLLELEPDSADQARQDDGAFAMKPLRSKFFWLCGECSKTHIVKQWKTAGPVLVVRSQKTAGGQPNSITPTAAATTQPLPVSPIVPPLPPMADPLHRSAGDAENFSWPKGRVTAKTVSSFPRHARSVSLSVSEADLRSSYSQAGRDPA